MGNAQEALSALLRADPEQALFARWQTGHKCPVCAWTQTPRYQCGQRINSGMGHTGGDDPMQAAAQSRAQASLPSPSTMACPECLRRDVHTLCEVCCQTAATSDLTGHAPPLMLLFRDQDTSTPRGKTASGQDTGANDIVLDLRVETAAATALHFASSAPGGTTQANYTLLAIVLFNGAHYYVIAYLEHRKAWHSIDGMGPGAPPHRSKGMAVRCEAPTRLWRRGEPSAVILLYRNSSIPTSPTTATPLPATGETDSAGSAWVESPGDTYIAGTSTDKAPTHIHDPRH